jgi:hypothetical protein
MTNKDLATSQTVADQAVLLAPSSARSGKLADRAPFSEREYSTTLYHVNLGHPAPLQAGPVISQTQLNDALIAFQQYIVLIIASLRL